MFEYPCPECETTNIVHDASCPHDHDGIDHIRKAYTDILSVLLTEGAERERMDAPPGISFQTLREKVNEILQSQAPDQRGLWRDLHTDCLHELKNRRRVAEADEMGGLYLKQPEERAQEIIPTFDPIKTIYEHGPVDGAKDYSMYSMVSWTELAGLTWEEAKNFLTEWLEETNSWDDLHWGESSINQLLESKRHVHERELGWGDYAEIAAGHIRQSNREKQIDAYAKANQVSSDDYSEEDTDE